MGNVKYSQIKTSNGDINFNENSIFEKEFDTFEYLKIYDVVGHYKVYINNSKDYIELVTTNKFTLEDFSINSIKIECTSKSNTDSIKYYVCK
ncbi:hypothetical protein ACQX0N_09405 [Clostridium tepidum]